MTRIISTGPSVSAAQYCVTRADQLRPRCTPQMSLNVSSMRESIMIAMNTSISAALAETALACWFCTKVWIVSTSSCVPCRLGISAGKISSNRRRLSWANSVPSGTAASRRRVSAPSDTPVKRRASWNEGPAMMAFNSVSKLV